VTFDPLELTPEASMNGTFLADLPGAEPAWVGRIPLHLTSLRSLLERAAAAGLGTSTTGSDVAHILGALASDDATRAARAAEVVGSFGRALGHLIATLKVGPPSAPHSLAFPSPGVVAPSDWRTAYLNHWARVERIWLGGGLTAALGDVFVDPARAEVERLGVHGCPIDLAAHADVLALIGAARSHREPTPVAVVLDFGGSAVKRAMALARGGVLERLEMLSARPAPPLGQHAASLASFVVETIVDTLQEAERAWDEVDPYVAVSIASYVAAGRPISAHGTYGSLGRLDRRQLEAELQLKTGVPVRLEFLHDGTAAARGLVDPGQAGLIVLGSYLAAGFPPPAGRLAPLADDFSIRRASN
jgi:hypothetical protein